MPVPPVTLRYRQIHLDFHTSPDIEGIGAEFDPDEFASTLQAAHVNSVTSFARCHHGWIYYATKAHPERVHPHLARPNLLLEQIEACHRRGIRVPIYTTIEWDDYTADQHRDWLLIDENGCEFGTKPLEAGFYRSLDVLHPGYRQFLRDHIADIFACVPVDGFFFDIVIPRASTAKHWLDAMDNASFDPESPQARAAFSRKVIDDWKAEMTEWVTQQPGYTRECSIFYNSGHVGPRHRTSGGSYTHYELESLPSGGWGYLHFPLTQRYVRGLGKNTLGMTGKFHTSWGDFHSFKNPAALEFECMHMLALGARCGVGDQLLPSGKIDAATYDLIGGVYAQVEAKEPWCVDARPVVDIALFTPEEFALRRQSPDAWEQRLPEAAMGALRMLQEMQAQFDIVTSDRDLSQYKLLILPDCIPLDAELAAKLQGYLAGGGAIVASGESGLNPEGDAFALTKFGIEFVGPAPYEPDFIVPGPEVVAATGMPATGHVMYKRGMEVRAAAGSQVLAQVEASTFNRTWRHFCSHRHSPSSGKVAYPGMVRTGSVIYLAHPVFTTYHDSAPLWCRKLVEAAVSMLAPRPAVEVDGPSSLLSVLTSQPAENRMVLHLLHYIPERRGQQFDVIEDVIPVHGIEVAVRTDATNVGVRIVPDGEALGYQSADGYVRFTVPEVNGHAMVEIVGGLRVEG